MCTQLHACAHMHFLIRRFGHRVMVDRPLTLGAAGGSFSALLWRLVAEASTPSLQVPVVDCPLCPTCEVPVINFGPLDPTSILVGIFLGLAIGPILDLLLVIRATWRWWVRTRLRDLVQFRPGQSGQAEWYRLA